MVIEHFNVVVVGAGHAGTQLATSLAASDPGLSVALVGDESDAPYDRPTLSKAFLVGASEVEDIQLRTADFWADGRVELRLSSAVVRVEPDEHRVEIADGSSLAYDHLVWAAGGRARRLPTEVARAPYVTVRSLEDVRKLRTIVRAASHAVLVGGGYVGLEAAAVLRSLNVEVTLVEAAPRLLARVAGEEVSAFLEQEHRKAGVDIRLSTSLTSLSSGEGERHVVGLSDGTEVVTDVVIVGIGMIPNVEVLASAGAAVDDGLVVDHHCRTSLADVFAIGDCAKHVSRFAGFRAVRLECVQNAVDQAKTVHGVLTGDPQPYDAVPWFWSNQYDVRLKSAGLAVGADRAVLRGEPAAGSFSVVYLRGRALVAVDAVNSPKDFLRARQLLHDEAELDVDRCADPTVDLRDAVLRPAAAVG